MDDTIFIVFTAAADSGPMINAVHHHEDDAREAVRGYFHDYGYGDMDVVYARLKDTGIVEDADTRPVVDPIMVNAEGDVAVWIERHSVR